MRQLTTTQKLWACLGVFWLAMLILVGWGAWENRQTLLDERRLGLTQHIDLAVSVIDEQAQRVERGEVELAEAQRLAAETLSRMSYDETRGYFYVFDDDFLLFSHPRLAVGTDLSNFQNDEGRYLFREFAEDVANDDGFVDYLWAHQEGDALTPKSSYHERVADWGWIVGTGVYVDDIDAAFITTLLHSGLILAAIGGPVTLIMGLVIRGIRRRLGGDPAYAASVVRRIADGRLDEPARVDSGDTDSLLHDIERMRASLSATIGDIHASADELGDVVGRITTDNAELASRTEQQAASLAETASSMEELTVTVRHNADNANQARELSSGTAREAAEGNDAMQAVVVAIGEVSESAAQMTAIVDTIDAIAFQTNILALNASVEAARAGEHGRGFAVVAEEVRHLASRSADAAREIKTLIQRCDERVGEGNARIQETDAKIRAISNDVQRLSHLIQEISSASGEQRLGIEQVGEAVAQMDQVTQRNAGLVEGHSALASRLTAQSEALRRHVARFERGASPNDAIKDRDQHQLRNPRATEMCATADRTAMAD